MKKRMLYVVLISTLGLLLFAQTIFAKEGSLLVQFAGQSQEMSNLLGPDGAPLFMPPPVKDQSQESTDYGFWFDSDDIRWQEFIPTIDNVFEVELYISKNGSPGDVTVEIRDETGTITIDQVTLLESEVSTGWVSFQFTTFPSPDFTPGMVYRIYVYSSVDSTSPSDRYAWRGSSSSTYCPRCDTDVSGSWPDYDYAFATYGTGVRRITTADFDGDRSTDVSVYRPSNGNWYVMGDSPISWGLSGDLPVPGDYTGDGHNVAVYRPSNGNWYVMGVGVTSWGYPDDVPVQADYDGDGATDIAVLRPSNGNWYIQGMGSYSWYHTDDIPVPCDYDGDFADEIAVYRPSNGNWYVMGMGSTSWGHPGDIPVPGDYDGDGTCDIAVYRPSNGNWYVMGMGSTSWGFTGDIPVPGDYDGCGDTEIAVLRPSNGKWYIKGFGNFNWYHSGDYPLPVRDTNADGDVYQ